MLERYRVTHWGLIADPDGELVKYAEAQATIADLQGQLKAAKAPRMYDCGSCAIGKGFEQRVAQLEADNRTYINERHENMKTIETLQADHARVLGLVQALDGRFWNYEQKMCDRERAGLTKEQRTGACIVLHWLNEQIKAASLPAQRAKLAQGGASKEAMT